MCLSVPTASVRSDLPGHLTAKTLASNFVQLGSVLFLKGAFFFPIWTQIIVFDVFLGPCLSEALKSHVSSTRLVLPETVYVDITCLFLPHPAFAPTEERSPLLPPGKLCPELSIHCLTPSSPSPCPFTPVEIICHFSPIALALCIIVPYQSLCRFPLVSSRLVALPRSFHCGY